MARKKGLRSATSKRKKTSIGRALFVQKNAIFGHQLMKKRLDILGNRNLGEVNAHLRPKPLREHHRLQLQLERTREELELVEIGIRGLIAATRIENQKNPSPQQWRELGKLRTKLKEARLRRRLWKEDIKHLQRLIERTKKH